MYLAFIQNKYEVLTTTSVIHSFKHLSASALFIKIQITLFLRSANETSLDTFIAV